MAGLTVKHAQGYCVVFSTKTLLRCLCPPRVMYMDNGNLFGFPIQSFVRIIFPSFLFFRSFGGESLWRITRMLLKTISKVLPGHFQWSRVKCRKFDRLEREMNPASNFACYRTMFKVATESKGGRVSIFFFVFFTFCLWSKFSQTWTMVWLTFTLILLSVWIHDPFLQPVCQRCLFS